jgi:hypothetical protein
MNILKNILVFTAFTILTSAISSCKKCTTCVAIDTSGHTIASQKYCSTSSTNVSTFEQSWKTTYGAAASCKRN